jgi:hypothetical protein
MYSKIHAEFTEKLEEVDVLLEVAANMADENPEIITNIGHLVVKYWEALRPMVTFVVEDMVQAKIDAYRRVRNELKLTEDQAIRFLSGC